MPVASTNLMEITDLRKWYTLKRGLFSRRPEIVKAVDGVSLTIRRGEVLGLVGESGSGKSTIGRTILRLTEPTAGRILFDGQDIAPFSRRQLRSIRRKMQLVIQDPFSSLNPRMTVERIVASPIRIQEPRTTPAERRQRVEEMLR